MVFALPALEALDYVRMLQFKAFPHVCQHRLELLLRQVVGVAAQLAPGDVDANLRVERLVDGLEAATADDL